MDLLLSPKAKGASQHKATLLGANKQQDVNFLIQKDGIAIHDSKRGSLAGNVIATIAFPYVYKIARAKDAKGAPRILDITVQTRAGLQNLKMLCPSTSAVRCITTCIVPM
jgi:hypothetical protein